jgi:hypothetical protein
MPINRMFGSSTLRNLIQARTKDSNIKVVFGAKGGSRTDGNTIYVSDIPDSADPNARLLAEKSAYHEAEHVRALDEYRKTNPGATIPKLIQKMQSKCRPEHAALAANIWNAVEDARIDNTENDRYPGTIEKYRDATRIFNETLDPDYIEGVPSTTKILLMLWYKARERYYAKCGIDGVPSVFSQEDEELFDQTLGSILPKIETLTGIDDSMDLAKEAYDNIVEAFKEPPPPPQQEQNEEDQTDTESDPDVGDDAIPSNGDPSDSPDGEAEDESESDSQDSQAQPKGASKSGPESGKAKSGMGSDEEEVDDTDATSESDPGSDPSDGGRPGEGDEESDEDQDQAEPSTPSKGTPSTPDVPDGEPSDPGSDPNEQASDLGEDSVQPDDQGGVPSESGNDQECRASNQDAGQEDSEAEQEEGEASDSSGETSKVPGQVARAKALEAGPEALEGNPTLDINGAFSKQADRITGAFYSDHPDVSDRQYDCRKPTHDQGALLVSNGNRFFAGTEGKIRRLLVDERAPKVRDSLRSGRKLDSRHLYRTAELKMGKMPMIWKDVQEGRKIDTAVSIIIDQSGSMSGSRWQTVTFLTASLCKILDSLSVKYSVIGVDCYGNFTNDNKEGERVDNARYFRYNAWGTRMNPNSIPLSVSGGGTPTAEMIRIGLTELGARTETRKVLMVMTDGDPSYAGRNEVTSYAIDFCDEHIKAARKYGCKVFGFGIDINRGSGCEYTMHKIFGKGWADLPNFTQDANKHASKIMQKLEEAFRE